MIYDILYYISTTKVAGFIPLDKVAHFIVGLIWTVFGLKKNYSFKKVFIGLLLIAVLKEVHDFAMTKSPLDLKENILDISVTVLYIFVLFFVRKLKGRLDKDTVSEKRWKIY